MKKKEALTLTTEETAAWVIRMQAGEDNAFDVLFAAYQQQAVRTAALICGDASMAEDITQEAFVTCMLQISSLRNPYRFPAWFFQILTRCAWKYAKKANKLVPSEALSAHQADGLPPVFDHYPSEKRAMYESLYRAIDGLGRKQRTTVILYYFNDFSVKEIAQITSSLEATVKSRLFAAKKQLQRVLAAEEVREKGALVYEKR